MTDFAKCKLCGKRVLLLTMQRNRGMCVPCARRIEALRKVPRAALRALLTLPSFLRDELLSSMQRKRERRPWPLTMDQAVDRLCETIEPQDLARFHSLQEFVLEMHFSLGQGIRNEFGLWAGNAALLKDCGEEDPDSASAVILERLWARLRGD